LLAKAGEFAIRDTVVIAISVSTGTTVFMVRVVAAECGRNSPITRLKGERFIAGAFLDAL
jgi:hypothetical protein